MATDHIHQPPQNSSGRFYLPSADFDVDHRDVAAQKRLLRERMAGLGWLVPDILAHLEDTPDFYLDQVAQVVMDRWSSGRVALLGDAAFSSSPMSGQGTGLALVGAYLLAGELAAAGWDPDAGFAHYKARMRSFVEANQEIGQLNARSRDVPGPDTGVRHSRIVGELDAVDRTPDQLGEPCAGEIGLRGWIRRRQPAVGARRRRQGNFHVAVGGDDLHDSPRRVV
ncbi:FAD-dependent monooxygenase [Streptomyces sp. NPDC006530]|uniref:FAD-dependent monooxygenase n=1 Tax=Streptomyces sp. NPDC006530 TaxID=3364750 RepID=UPI00367E5C3C